MSEDVKCLGTCHPLAHSSACPMNPQKKKEMARQLLIDKQFAVGNARFFGALSGTKAGPITPAEQNLNASDAKGNPDAAFIAAQFLAVNAKHNEKDVKCRPPTGAAPDADTAAAAAAPSAVVTQDKRVQDKACNLIAAFSVRHLNKEIFAGETRSNRLIAFALAELKDMEILKIVIDVNSIVQNQLIPLGKNNNDLPKTWPIPQELKPCAHQLAAKLASLIPIYAEVVYEDICMEPTCLYHIPCHHPIALALRKSN